MLGKLSYALSVLVLVAGLGWAMSTAWQFRDAQRAQGVITKVDRDVGDTGPIYWPYFEFRDGQGAIHVRRFSVGVESKETYEVGDQVEVLYPIGEPQKARVSEWVQIWLKPMLVVILGGAAFWVTRMAKAGVRQAQHDDRTVVPKTRKQRGRR